VLLSLGLPLTPPSTRTICPLVPLDKPEESTILFLSTPDTSSVESSLHITRWQPMSDATFAHHLPLAAFPIAITHNPLNLWSIQPAIIIG
jgi:hypothetical protein